MAKLKPRKELFVKEYLADRERNATRAAIAAGYSKKTAYSIGSRLLKTVDVSKRIEELTAKRAEKLEITADRVLREIALLGFSNMQDYIRTNSEGDVYVNLGELDRDKAAAIQEVTVDVYTEGHGEQAREVKKTKFKLADKRGSLELLGKYFKLFTEELNVNLSADPDSELAELIGAGSAAAHRGAAVQ